MSHSFKRGTLLNCQAAYHSTFMVMQTSDLPVSGYTSLLQYSPSNSEDYITPPIWKLLQDAPKHDAAAATLYGDFYAKYKRPVTTIATASS